jgi:hypothetical protein
MCLFSNVKATEQYLLRAKSGASWCYKFMRYDPVKDRLISPYKDKPYKVGIIQSSSRRKRICKGEFEKILHGIHVYLYKSKANYECALLNNNFDDIVCVVLPVYAKAADLIAVSDRYDNEAVFTKVEVTHQAYQNALNKARRLYKRKHKG